MATRYLTSWDLVAQAATPEYGWNGGATFRETETRTYQVYVTAKSTMPASPVNPGGLSPTGWTPSGAGYTRIGSWVCTDRGFQKPYGNPGAKLYHETWQKVGAWEREV